mmetsp:Transcript_72471/g.117532  ORF Transcript_72471/g.117532 Transcript_72471/m.117532 type:complete len:287 (-) Transcript_72471:21-881(-)
MTGVGLPREVGRRFGCLEPILARGTAMVTVSATMTRAAARVRSPGHMSSIVSPPGVRTTAQETARVSRVLTLATLASISLWEAMDPNANAIILFGTSTALALNAPIIAGAQTMVYAIRPTGLACASATLLFPTLASIVTYRIRSTCSIRCDFTHSSCFAFRPFSSMALQLTSVKRNGISWISSQNMATATMRCKICRTPKSAKPILKPGRALLLWCLMPQLWCDVAPALPQEHMVVVGGRMLLYGRLCLCTGVCACVCIKMCVCVCIKMLDGCVCIHDLRCLCGHI